MNRTQRQKIAQQTVEICQHGFYVSSKGNCVDIARSVQNALEKTQLFRPHDFGSLRIANRDIEYSMQVEVTEETTLQAAQRLKNERTLCLNFASAKNAGGGFLSGSQAQEESLARSSALYICQTSQPEMYEFNRRLTTCLYSDHMILSRDVPIFRDDDGALVDEPFTTAFLTVPAVNAGAVRRNEPENVAQIEPTMCARLRKILVLARHFEYSNLVLGAWGCGVFANEPSFVARLFADELRSDGEFGRSFKRVVYAIYDSTPDKNVLRAFENILL